MKPLLNWKNDGRDSRQRSNVQRTSLPYCIASIMTIRRFTILFYLVNAKPDKKFHLPNADEIITDIINEQCSENLNFEFLPDIIKNKLKFSALNKASKQ